MILFQKVLLGLVVVTLVVSMIFFILHFKAKRKIRVDEELKLKNNKLNLMLAIIFLIGSIIVAIMIPLAN